MQSPTVRRSFLSLQAKITALIVGMMVTTIGILIGVTAYTMIQEAETLIERQSTSLSALLAENSAGAIRFGKTEAIEQSFQKLFDEAEGELKAVLALDKQGQVLVNVSNGAATDDAVRAGQDAMAAGSGAFDGNTMIHPNAVFFGKKNDLVGGIVLVWSQEYILATVGTEIVTEVMIIVPVGAIGMLILHLMMSRMLFRPLRDLSESANGVAEGRAVTGPAMTRDDPIGEAMRALAGLSHTIERSADAAGRFAQGDLTADVSAAIRPRPSRPLAERHVPQTPRGVERRAADLRAGGRWQQAAEFCRRTDQQRRAPAGRTRPSRPPRRSSR